MVLLSQEFSQVRFEFVDQMVADLVKIVIGELLVVRIRSEMCHCDGFQRELPVTDALLSHLDAANDQIVLGLAVKDLLEEGTDGSFKERRLGRVKDPFQRSHINQERGGPKLWPFEVGPLWRLTRLVKVINVIHWDVVRLGIGFGPN